MPIDLKGFIFSGHDFSWPELDPVLGTMTRPAHAHNLDERFNETVCGEPWPHVWYSREPLKSTGYVPHPDMVAKICEDTWPFLCEKCLATLGIIKTTSTPTPIPTPTPTPTPKPEGRAEG